MLSKMILSTILQMQDPEPSANHALRNRASSKHMEAQWSRSSLQNDCQKAGEAGQGPDAEMSFEEVRHDAAAQIFMVRLP